MAELDGVIAKQFGTNVYTKAQQEYSILRPLVTTETVTGEKKSIPRVNPTEAADITEKYGDTVWTHTTFDSRWMRPHKFGWADALDWDEKQGMGPIIDPTSSIVRAGGMAVARKIDRIIIEDAFYGASFNGVEGLETSEFPNSQKIAITVGGAGGANAGLTIEKLMAVHDLLADNDVDVTRPENKLYIAVTQHQIRDLMKGIDPRDNDYDGIKALYERKTDTFLGFQFVRINLLRKTALDSGYSRLCCAWVKSGIVYGSSKEPETKISTRPDKWDIWQVTMTGKACGARSEDAKVIQVPCLEA